jgi:hypothetical protein
LSDVAGLVREAQPLVSEFLESDDKRAVIEKMKKVAGAAFYVKVMERYVTNGPEQVNLDVGSILALMDLKKSSWNAVDGMKRRLNVFKQFIMTSAVLPEETDDL